MRAWGPALLLLGLLCPKAFAAEIAIGRQVQAWRPRPLEALPPEVAPPEKAAIASEAAKTVSLARPAWEAWIIRILNGQPLILFQPSWKGAWPRPQNPWTISLTPSLRGHPEAGFGPELALSGAWHLAGFQLEGQTQELWTENNRITSWRTVVTHGGVSLECRGWLDGGFRAVELATTASYRQSF